MVALTAPSNDQQAAGGTPVPEDVLATEYDADFVAAYWARRPAAVSVRSAQVAVAALRMGSGLLLDAIFGRCDVPLDHMHALVERWHASWALCPGWCGPW